MSEIHNEKRLTEETHAFFACLRAGRTKQPRTVIKTTRNCKDCEDGDCRKCAGYGEVACDCDCPNCDGDKECAECNGTGDCVACYGNGVLVTRRHKYRAHPADEWTLRALNKLSINGSFT